MSTFISYKIARLVGENCNGNEVTIPMSTYRCGHLMRGTEVSINSIVIWLAKDKMWHYVQDFLYTVLYFVTYYSASEGDLSNRLGHIR